MPENTKPAQDIPAARSETYAKLYANAANIEVTPWDFKLIFGELKRSGTTFSIEQHFEVAMSPQHAKALSNLLNQNLREYEQQIGEIKLPRVPEAQSSDPVLTPHIANRA
jgi:Protein of unknown function (DUF3467)